MSTNHRLEKFRSLKNHAWLKKCFKKLSAADIELAERFLIEHAALDKNDFEFKVNRMFLDHPSKPSNWPRIIELVSNSNVS